MNESSPPVEDAPSLIGLAIVVEGGILVLALVCGWLFQCWPLVGDVTAVQPWVQGLMATMPMLFIFFLLILFPIGPIQEIHLVFDHLVRPAFARATVLDMLLISVLAGLGEEALFRGFIQAFLGHYINPWIALGIASILFGLVHLVTPSYAILAALIGAYLGWVWMETESLLPAAVAHATYDFVVLYYLLRIHPHLLEMAGDEDEADSGDEDDDDRD